ncbi:MAG: hypothetical protein KatS3mg122_3298 [Caldimonas sp.]|nr:MAG: hypothetical protein KatS3mg122_3298 [Caldimonas sp.]
MCSETCVGRIRYLGVLLYDADRIEQAASVEHDRDLYQAQLDIFLDPNDPQGASRRRAPTAFPRPGWRPHATAPSTRWPMDWKVALPLHPEYRTLPMVWYVPPLSPIQAAANAGEIGVNGALPDVSELRIPLQVPGQPADRGRRGAGGARAGADAGDARLPCATGTCEERRNHEVLQQADLTESQAEAMYRYMAIANYEDRFVIPTTHREYAENAFDLRGGCGFSFGNGCSDGQYRGPACSAARRSAPSPSRPPSERRRPR